MQQITHDGYVVLKLISGEEIVAAVVDETSDEITVMMPMVVRYVPKMMGVKVVESVLLAPYSQFVDDDVYTFDKHNLLYLKNMDQRFIPNYEDAVDLHITPPEQSQSRTPVDDQALKETLEKLQNVFGGDFEPRMDEDEYMDQLLDFKPDTKKFH